MIRFAPIPLEEADGTPFSVAPHSGGSLSCSGRRCKNERWCEHIQEVVTSGQDAPSVWEHGMSVDPRLPFVEIPVMPTQDVWAKVHLERMSDSALKVTVNAPFPAILPPGDGFSPGLGYIGEGEGRAVIRDMILGWFEPWYDKESNNLACENIAHGVGQTMQVVRSFGQNPVNRFINSWTTFFFRQCMICWKNARRQVSPGSSTQNFPPDLIPRV